MNFKTFSTIKKLTDKLYYMEYLDDYKFDEFLKAGASSDYEVHKFIEKHLLGGGSMDFAGPDMGCSAFSSYLKNGEKVFGRNFDEAECGVLVLKTKPMGGFASLTVVNLNYIGITTEKLPMDMNNLNCLLMAAPYVPMDGVNEKGLTVSILKIKQKPTMQERGKIPLTSPTMMRAVLDKCVTVDEAVALYDSFDMHSSANVDFHYHISDAFGNSAVIEYIGGVMSVVNSRSCTNFLLTESVKVGGGHDRYEAMENYLNEKQDILENERDAMKVLTAASANSTRWSAIYNQTNPSLLLSVFKDYENLFEFKL
ncbi:MAG: linear amide C-N hydrolase [Ruminococcaceae bacterium]|nr:linear amide C-N hydrolase [Oscillospiraceae bacterium]